MSLKGASKVWNVVTSKPVVYTVSAVGTVGAIGASWWFGINPIELVRPFIGDLTLQSAVVPTLTAAVTGGSVFGLMKRKAGKEHADLNAELEDLKVQIGDLPDREKDLEEDLAKLAEDKKQLAADLKKLKTERTALEKDRKQLEADGKSLTKREGALKRAQKALSDGQAALEAGNAQLEKDQAALVKEKKAFATKSTKANKDRSAKEQTLNQREAALDALEVQLNNRNRALQDQADDLERMRLELEAEQSSEHYSHHSSEHDVGEERASVEELVKSSAQPITIARDKERNASREHSAAERSADEIRISSSDSVPKTPSPGRMSPTRH